MRRDIFGGEKDVVEGQTRNRQPEKEAKDCHYNCARTEGS